MLLSDLSWRDEKEDSIRIPTHNSGMFQIVKKIILIYFLILTCLISWPSFSRQLHMERQGHPCMKKSPVLTF